MIKVLNKKECMFLRELAALLTKYNAYIRGDKSVGTCIYVRPDDQDEMSPELEFPPIHFLTSFDADEIEALFNDMLAKVNRVSENKENKIYFWRPE